MLILKEAIKGADTKYTKTEEYIKEKFPNKDDTDNEDDIVDLQGITFKGKSRMYVTAYNRMREKLCKGTECQVEEFNLKIKDTPKGKPKRVELSHKGDKEGHAQIQVYKP